MSSIHSFWHITYGGPQHGVMLKKLERMAGFKAVDPVVEKLRWDGQAIAHVSFLVEHMVQDWPTAQQAMLALAWKLAPTWRMTRSGNDLKGEWSQNAVGPNAPFEPIVAACQRIDWFLDESQNYTRPNYLQGQANHW